MLCSSSSIQHQRRAGSSGPRTVVPSFGSGDISTSGIGLRQAHALLLWKQVFGPHRIAVGLFVAFHWLKVCQDPLVCNIIEMRDSAGTASAAETCSSPVPNGVKAAAQ